MRGTVTPDRLELVDELHAQAICRRAIDASRAVRQGDSAEARRIAHATARLCQEIGGLWANPALLEPR